MFTDVTWENTAEFQEAYPDFNLEDMVVVDEGSIDGNGAGVIEKVGVMQEENKEAANKEEIEMPPGS